MTPTEVETQKLLAAAHRALDSGVRARRVRRHVFGGVAAGLAVGLAVVIAGVVLLPRGAPSVSPPQPRGTASPGIALAGSSTLTAVNALDAPWLEIISEDAALEAALAEAGECARVVRSGRRVLLVSCAALEQAAPAEGTVDDRTADQETP